MIEDTEEAPQEQRMPETNDADDKASPSAADSRTHAHSLVEPLLVEVEPVILVDEQHFPPAETTPPHAHGAREGRKCCRGGFRRAERTPASSGQRCWCRVVHYFVLAVVLMVVLFSILGHYGVLSCQGDNSCADSSSSRDGRKVSFFSCNGDGACARNQGTVAMFSCNGDQACADNVGHMARFSCNGDSTCQQNAAVIGSKSCNGDVSCPANNGTIGDASCNGDGSCSQNVGTIDSAACNGDVACDHNHKHITRGTCNGDGVCPGEQSG